MLTLNVTVWPATIEIVEGVTSGVEGEVQLMTEEDGHVKFSADPDVCAVTVIVPPGYRG